jgi:hypothetical protein
VGSKAKEATKTEQLAALALGVPVDRLIPTLRSLRKKSPTLDSFVATLQAPRPDGYGVPVKRTFVNTRLMYGLRRDWPDKREDVSEAA